MGETTKTQKTSWFKGMKAEFKKIIWPDQKSLTKQTIAVVSVSVALALIISSASWTQLFSKELIC